jgi:hypothetical protein
MKLIIDNKSVFPTAYIKNLAMFIINYIGKEKFNYNKFTIEVKNHGHSWRGRAWLNYIIIGMYRHFHRINKYGHNKWPYHYKDGRFKYSKEHSLNDRIEIMVYLIAHELYHSTYKHEYSRSREEFLANDFAYKMVNKYREIKNKLWIKIREDIRKEHKRSVKKVNKEKEVKAKKKSPEFKLEHNKTLYEKWNKQKKHCENMMKKYRQKIKYYERRMAAKI